MALSRSETEFLKDYKNGDSNYKDNTLKALQQGNYESFFFEHREFVEEFIKVDPWIVTYFGKIPNTEKLKNDEELNYSAVTLSVRLIDKIDKELLNTEKFQQLKTKINTVEAEVIEREAVIYKAFLAKNIKLKDIHPYVFLRTGNAILREVKKRVMDFFEEKTKGLPEDQMVASELEDKLTKKMEECEQIVAEKRSQAQKYNVDSFAPLSNWEEVNEELKEYVQNIQQIQLNNVANQIEKMEV